MSRRIRDHLRSNVVGYAAVFIALSGTAYAVDGPLPGTDQVGSADIINGEVKTGDLEGSSVAAGKIADGAVTGAKLADNAITDTTLNPLTGSTKIAAGAIKAEELGTSSVFGDEVAKGSLQGTDIADDSIGSVDVADNHLKGTDIADASITAADLANDSVNTGEVALDSLTGSDVNESTFSALDGADFESLGCDPSADAYIDCGSVTFIAGRSMPVLTVVTYGFSTLNGDPSGDCRTTLDGSTTSVVHNQTDDDFVNTWLGATPITEVVTVGPGAHRIGFDCLEVNPDNHDIEYKDIRIAVVELGMD